MFILRFSLLVCISFFMVSCDRIDEAINHGTLKGFNHCVEDLKSEYVSDKAVKISCVAKHQKNINSNQMMLFAFLSPLDYAKEAHSTGNFSLENSSNNYIVTGYEFKIQHHKNYEDLSKKINCITVRVYDVDGIETTDPNIPDCEITTFNIEIDRLWIEPHETDYSTKQISIPWYGFLDVGPDRNFFYSLKNIYGIEIN